MSRNACSIGRPRYTALDPAISKMRPTASFAALTVKMFASRWRTCRHGHVAESLRKGMRVIVAGRLKQRDYQANDGTSRTVYELDADDIAPSLKWATATITKSIRDKVPHPAGDADHWQTAAPAAPGSGFSEEPPF